MHVYRTFGAVLLFACLAQGPNASAVTRGQVDTFEDGTTQGWLVNLLGQGGSVMQPVNVATGGPAGVDDNFLRLMSTGDLGTGGGRLAVINFLGQWAGDYLAAGVTAITMDVNNLGNTDLSLRLYFADPTTGPPTNAALSTQAVVLPAGSGWMPVVFPITPDDLTASLGSVATALTNATELRLYHNPAAVYPGPAIQALLGVDNIRAVPEPATLVLLSGALPALYAAGRRRILRLSGR